MLSTISGILNSPILSKVGDWALGIFKIQKQEKQYDMENKTTIIGPILVLGDPWPGGIQSPAPNEPVGTSSVVLPTLPNESIVSSIVPPITVVLPASQPEEEEFEYGTDEYITQLLKSAYKNKRSDDDFGIGLGNTNELVNKGTYDD